MKLIPQVGSVDEAKAAADGGADPVMIQGIEAGSHVRGTTALSVVLPEVVAAVAPLPVGPPAASLTGGASRRR